MNNKNILNKIQNKNNKKSMNCKMFYMKKTNKYNN